jgi:hypothetical protein
MRAPDVMSTATKSMWRSRRGTRVWDRTKATNPPCHADTVGHAGLDLDAKVEVELRRLKTRSTPSSSTKDVETFSSPRVVRMHVAATRYSVARAPAALPKC